MTAPQKPFIYKSPGGVSIGLSPGGVWGGMLSSFKQWRLPWGYFPRCGILVLSWRQNTHVAPFTALASERLGPPSLIIESALRQHPNSCQVIRERADWGGGCFFRASATASLPVARRIGEGADG